MNRRRFLDRPFPAFTENGDSLIWTRPEMWVGFDVDGWTVIEWDGRFHYRVRTKTLESNTHIRSQISAVA